MPERLGAAYIGEDSARHTPVMLHRAILGSLERFIGILIEQYAGNFPLWLSPVQLVVLNITDRQAEYAEQVRRELEKQGIRVKLDLRNEKIGFKIREHSMQRTPYIAIVGDKEMENQVVALRSQQGEDLGVMSVNDLINRLLQDIADKK